MKKRVYEKRVSQRGRIQDQMNCLVAYMEGYGYKLKGSDEDQKRVRDLRYMYRYNHVQWQIGQIECLSDQIGLNLVEMFQLGEFLFNYCPSFKSTQQDYDRLRRLGASVRAMGLDATRAQDVGKIQDIQEQLDSIKAQAERLGLDLKVEFV